MFANKSRLYLPALHDRPEASQHAAKKQIKKIATAMMEIFWFVNLIFLKANL